MIFIILLGTLICCVFYIASKEISTREFLLLSGAIILSTLLIYGISVLPVPNDIFFESGRLSKTVYHPYFVEEYEESHESCTGKGEDQSCSTYYTTEYAKHRPYWVVKDTLGRDWKVTESFHNIVKSEFGNKVITTRPNKCTNGGHFHKGDPYLYTYNNETNTYKFPVNDIHTWHNPLKGKKSIFNSKSEYKKEYPKSIDAYNTNRLQTNKTNITQKEWDILNTKVYEIKKVNLILTEVNNSEEAKQLEDYWIGGKFNDLVICFVGESTKPSFIKVFGWSKSSLVKYKLENYLLENGVQKSSLDGIQNIITTHYSPFDFTQFNYLTTPPSPIVFIIALVVAIIIGVGLGSVYSNNREDKNYHDPYFF